MALDTTSLGHRLDSLHAITRELNAGLNLDDWVLKRFLVATAVTVGASNASLFLLDSHGAFENAFFISNFKVVERNQPTVEAIMDYGLVGWIRQHQIPVLIEDTQKDERWLAGNNSNNLEIRESRSALAVPIKLPEQLIGVLTVTSPQPLHFTPNDLTMLTILADQAAFAIANARLYNLEQQRRRLADTLVSMARTINATLNLEEVLSLILDQLAYLVPYNSCSIWLYHEESNSLSIKASRGTNMRATLSFEAEKARQSLNYEVMMTQKPIVIADITEESRWFTEIGDDRIRSWVAAPLMVQDKAIGMVAVDSYTPQAYNEGTVDDMAAFAQQAAIAVANAQAVTNLKNAQASYINLFEDSTDAVIISNYRGQILDANRKACLLLQQTKDDLLECDIDVLGHSLKQYLRANAAQLKKGEEASLEIELNDHVSDPISLELIARHVQYQGRDCVQWVGRDISSRREVERLRHDLVNMLVHDLRGPVGNLIGAVELMERLLQTDMDTNRLERLIGLALKSGQVVRDLVDSMLDVTRLERGEMPLQRTMTDLSKIVEQVRDQIEPRAGAKMMTLVIQPLPNISEVWIDGGIVRRVLVNLLDNGIKYTPQGGEVSLEVSADEHTIVFAISDSGMGIRKADQDHIFNKFARVDHSSAAPSGVGLGLAFCKLAAEAHGGAISVESEGIPGKGSTFYLAIPLLHEPYD